MLLTGTDGRKTLINLAHLAVARVESTTAPDVFAVVLYSRDRKGPGQCPGRDKG